MHVIEFRSLLRGALAQDPTGEAQEARALQLRARVRSTVDVLQEALIAQPALAPSWIREAWAQALAAGDRGRMTSIMYAVGWLPERVARGWGPAFAQAARQHPDLEVRRAVSRAFRRWGDPVSLANLRAFEADPALAADMQADLDELDPGSVPSVYDSRPRDIERRRAWEVRMNRLHGEGRSR